MQKKPFRGRAMRILRGAVQASGYQIVRLVDPEDSGILRFEETGEMPEGKDFAVLWTGPGARAGAAILTRTGPL